METKGKTNAQDFALALLASGPLTVGEAATLGGTRLLTALKQLTKHKVAPVTYSAGAFRPVPQAVR